MTENKENTKKNKLNFKDKFIKTDSISTLEYGKGFLEEELVPKLFSISSYFNFIVYNILEAKDYEISNYDNKYYINNSKLLSGNRYSFNEITIINIFNEFIDKLNELNTIIPLSEIMNIDYQKINNSFLDKKNISYIADSLTEIVNNLNEDVREYLMGILSEKSEEEKK